MKSSVQSHRRARVRALAALATILLACTLVNGLVGFLVAAAIVGCLLFRRRASDLLFASVLLLAAVPVCQLLVGLPDETTVSPGFVGRNDVASHLAFAGLACLCSGVLLSRRPISVSFTDAAPADRLASRAAASHVIQGSVWMILSVLVQASTNVIFWIVAAHAYDSNAVGRASGLITSVLFLNYATGLGLVVTVARFGTDRDPHANSLFSWALAVTTASSLIGTAIYLSIVSSPSTDLVRTWPGLLLTAGAVAGASIAALADVRLMAARKWNWVFVRLAFVGVSRFALLAIHNTLDPALWVFVAAVLPPAYSGLLALLLMPRFVGSEVRFRPRPQHLDKISRFAGFNFIATLSSQGPLFLLPVLVLLNVSAADNANFFLAWSATSVVFVLPTAIAQVVLVEGARRDRPSVSRSREALLLATGLALAGYVAALILEPLVVALYGDAYTQAAALLPTLLCAGIPWAYCSIRLSEARIRHDLASIVWITVTLGVAIIGLAAWLVPKEGITGAGRAWLIGNIAGGLVAVATGLRAAAKTPVTPTDGHMLDAEVETHATAIP
jgi:O-antigen/teichoic acid export membrane protein